MLGCSLGGGKRQDLTPDAPAGKTKKSAALASMHKLVQVMYAVVCKGNEFDPEFGRIALDVQDGI
jgi:hypothetical protein